MEFRKKIKSFISEIKESTTVKTPEDDYSPSLLSDSPAIAKFKAHINKPTDPLADQEILDSIEKDYFQESINNTSESPTHIMISKLASELSLSKIDEEKHILKKQLSAVSKKVSDLVLENHPSYTAELQRVTQLRQSLNTANVICSNGRRQLAQAKKNFTTSGLGLLANVKKRQQLIALLKSLRTIKTLQRTDIRLREMVDEGEYAGAIQLCLECQKAISNFRHYTCISELSSKLMDTLVMIEESLDVALSKTAVSFDNSHYEKVQTAYRLLGKTQTAMDQLHMHFTSAIHNAAFTIVLGYVELGSNTSESNFQKRHYADLCKHISIEMFTPCLIDLCKSLWGVMRSYYKTIQWHEKQKLDAQSLSNTDNMSVEDTFNRNYIKKKLDHGLSRIWCDVQQKVKIYLVSIDLSSFNYDEFIQVLDLVNRLIDVGKEFCGSKSEGLQESLRKQSINYFKSYHHSRMDELKMFLENEAWQLCPVKHTFSITQLQEFKFLRDVSSSESVTPDNSEKKGEGYFLKFATDGSPYDIVNEEKENEDILVEERVLTGHTLERALSNDSDSDNDNVIEELKQDFIDERTGEMPNKTQVKVVRKRSYRNKSAPIITNTTLNVVRLFGKYMQMMNVLKPIAFDVITCMSQLFDYYLYAVYSFFSDSVVKDNHFSSKMRTTLKRIHDNLILSDNNYGMASDDTLTSGVDELQEKVAYPHLSPIVELKNSDNLFGLVERIVATESLVFLAKQLEFLQPHLEAIIPSAKKAFLLHFYSQTVSTAHEMRSIVYLPVATTSLDFDEILQLISLVKWDIKDIMSQHSPYVDKILQEFSQFDVKLSSVVNRCLPLPEPVSQVIWEQCIKLTNAVFVDGYASAKKCTYEGRALMQLDFQQYLIKMEKISRIRPIPYRDYVEAYVKAYYLPEAQLEVWLRDHREYSQKQLSSLVNCVAHITKKARQRLLVLIDDIDKL